MATSTTKKVLIGVGIIGLIGLGVWLYRRSRKPKEEQTLKDVFDNLTFETGKDVKVKAILILTNWLMF